MKRVFDLLLSLLALLLLFLPMLLLAIGCKLSSKGAVLHWSFRVGINNELFYMPKFRTMFIGSPELATHLLVDSNKHLTGFGRFLRKTSLDELPQLFSILKGDMSFVGPRPALYNQDDLIEQRTQLGIHTIPPGLTGWAQINGRDELPIPVKVEYDYYYFCNRTVFLDLKIIIQTALKVIRREGVTH